MADWNSLLDDPLFNAGLGLLGGASTPNPWGAAADQLNRYQALRQNRELQKMHGKLYEAQARKYESDAAQAERERAEAEQRQAATIAWALKQPAAIRDKILAGIVSPKDLSQEASKTLFPKLENEEQYEPATGKTRRVLRDPYQTEAIPFGGIKQDILTPEELQSKLAEQQILLPGNLAERQAGATRVNVGGPQVVMPKDLSKAASDILVDSKAKAETAVNTLDTLSQIEGALNSGKVRLGPGTTGLQVLDQLSLALGIGGKDAAERVANTRLVIQGMAKTELDAAVALKGQGQVTENERDIVRRGALGEIDRMSEAELRVLIPTLRKTASYRLGKHREMVDHTERDYPGSATYFGVQAPAAQSGTGGLSPDERKELDRLRQKYRK